MDAEPVVPLKVRAAAIAVCVPLVVLVAWLLAIPETHPWREPTIDLLKSYTALLMAFWAGAHIGTARADFGHVAGSNVLVSVLPALIGWIALRFVEPWSFAILGLALAAQGAWDNIAAHRGVLPLWYGRLRVWMTFASVLAMVFGFLATAN